MNIVYFIAKIRFQLLVLACMECVEELYFCSVINQIT